jgi:outer membrane receptor protein involved in Fe transport
MEGIKEYRIGRNKIIYAGFDFPRIFARVEADIRIHLGTRALQRLTFQEFTPNTGAGNWHSNNPVNPPSQFNRLGYGILNLGVRYDLSRRLQLIAQFNNIFDTKYYTAAQLQGTAFTSTGSYIARPFPAVSGAFPVQQATFYAPGAPAAYWIGARVRF